uniref:Uncharacterized protein n=1 Tax=Chionoecetes opilio bacilliform virus TaxID=1825681 RepID=A0A1Q3DKZ0_9VIRU|nr:wsv134-like protein [Chionoecetes opilio bacilliform virus]GAV93170.1 hypothetical protein SCV_046 [Chionoecetes opilio bacilliform virus]
MDWFKHRNTRQGLFKTHTGQALVRSISRQSVSIETLPYTSINQQPGDVIEPTSAPIVTEPEYEDLSPYIHNNPVLKNYTRLVDSLRITSLPPDLDNDIVVYILDNENATISVDTMGIQIAVLRGKVCVYPRRDIGARVLCGVEGQQSAIFLNSLTNKWSHGCNTSYEKIKASIIRNNSHRKLTASVQDVRTILGLSPSQKLNIQHIFSYIFYT